MKYFRFMYLTKNVLLFSSLIFNLILCNKVDIILPSQQSIFNLEITQNLTAMVQQSFTTPIAYEYTFLNNDNALSLKNILCSKNETASTLLFVYNDPKMLQMAQYLRQIGFIVFTMPDNGNSLISSSTNDQDSAISLDDMSYAMSCLFPTGEWAEVAVFTDNSLDSRLIEKYVVEMTKINVKSRIVKFDNSTIASMEVVMITVIKKVIRHIVVISNEKSHILQLLKIAKTTKILQQNYFWALINQNILQSDITALLSPSDIPNIAVLNFESQRIFNQICNNSRCLEQPSYSIFYSALKISFSTAINVITSPSSPGLSFCQDGLRKTATANNYRLFVNSSDIFKKYQLDKSTFNVYTTKSIDTTPNVPNHWTYNSTFQLNSIINLKTRTVSKVNGQNLYLNIFQGWNNKTIYLCSPPLTPSLNYLNNDTYHSTSQITGVIKEMLVLLGQTMRFQPYVYEAADKLWGGAIANSPVLNYTGCIGDIYNGKSLFGAAVFTLNAARKRGVDFSVLFMDESNCAALQFPKPETKIWHVYRPLQWSVWLLVLICIGISAILCYVTAYYTPLSAWNLKLPFSIRDEVRIREHFWNVIGAFLLQGQDFYPYAMSSRVVLAMWWLFTLIIFSAYSADLTSFLTVKGELQTLKSLEELANRTDLTIMVPKDTIAANVIEQSDYWVYQKINQRKVYIQTIDECARNILPENASNLVCITDTSPVVYVVKRNCEKVYIIPETFNTAPMGFAIQSDAAFLPMLDLYIRKMMDNGQMEKWIDKYWSNNDPNVKTCNAGESSTDDSAPAIDLEGVGGVFIVCGALFVIAVLILIAEVIWVGCMKLPGESFWCQS